MNGYATREEYLKYLERLKRNREVEPWVSGTLMGNLLVRNQKFLKSKVFTNSNPNPKRSYKKKSKHLN